MRSKLAIVFVLFISVHVSMRPAAAAESTNAPPARLKISGHGFFGNLQLKKMMRILQDRKVKPEFFDGAFIEDAELLLRSRLRDAGYLEPVIAVHMVLADGRRAIYVWDESMEEPLPASLRAREVHFKIKEGILYYFKDLEFSGLDAIPEKRARGYFIETGGLVSLKQNRIYSPERLKRGLTSLSDELQRMGYQEASVVATNLHRDDRKGAVQVRVEAREGPKFIVRSVREEVFFEEGKHAGTRVRQPGAPYSKLWEQDFAQSIRTNLYRLGHPDAAVQLKTLDREPGTTNDVQIDIEAQVNTGPRVRIGDITFAGDRRTKPGVMERRLTIHEGDWLDRIKAEQSRYRLSRLGIFDSVELKYEPVNEDTRDVIYEVKEGKQLEVSLLAGYGSYELVRGGVQIDQYNVFGRAHHQQLKLVQSFKSSSADYVYTMPEFFGENLDVFVNGSGLRREEVSFLRVEYGGGIGVRKYLPKINTDMSTRYNYEILEASGAPADLAEAGLTNSRVAAIITDVNHDRRDSPLYPHRGYKAFVNLELASDYLGGDANYQRVDLAGSWHLPLSDSRWIHLGLSHGIIAAIANEDLPFNRRFFPGGENSIRGYGEGEAAPRNADGKIIGAETYLLVNIEFEQALTPSWSVVTFLDTVGFAQNVENYPGDEVLFSVGLGVRLKTFMGPVRLEYGQNLNARKGDPSGTLYFSLGFPF